MNINLTVSYLHNKSLFEESLLPFLSAKKKEILVIVTLAFSCLIACYYLYKCHFDKNNAIEIDPTEEAQKIDAPPEVSQILPSQATIEFESLWKNIVVSSKKCAEEAKRIKNAFAQSSYMAHFKSSSRYDEPAGTIYAVPNEFSFWMPGVAFVASYLSEKKNIEGLFVSQSVEAFSTRIKEIALSDLNCRQAFIVGCVQSGIALPIKPNFPQHKVAVVVEKNESGLTIALLESMPEPGLNAEVLPEHLKDNLWEGFKRWEDFNNQELVFRAIIKACHQTQCQARLLHSTVLRQRHYGCEVFALKDAIAFLRDPNFFTRITCGKTTTPLDPDYPLEQIIQLPPEFMVGVQSLKRLREYKNQVGEQAFDQPLVGKKRSLQNTLDKNTLTVGPEVLKKSENHYITKKHFKYLHLLVDALSDLPEEKVKAMIDRTLLTKIDTDLFPLELSAEAITAEAAWQDENEDERLETTKEKRILKPESAFAKRVRRYKLIV